MLISFFQILRSAGIPVTLKELLDLMAAFEVNLVFANMDEFYFLARTVMVKDEKYFDKFDKAFGPSLRKWKGWMI
jgi:hypothetical protein